MNHESLDRIQALQAAQAHQRKLTAPLASTRPTEQEREIRRLREVLEPFSKHGEEIVRALPDVPDDHIHDGISMRSWRIAARVGRAGS